MIPKLFPLLLTFFPDQNKIVYLQPQPQSFATNVFAMVTIRRIVWNTTVPTVMSQLLVTWLAIVCLSNATFAEVGVMEPISTPIETVQFVLNQGTSWMIAHLNVFPLHSHLPPMEVSLLPPYNHQSSRSLVIEPGAQLYGGGNVMILLLFCHTLLISFNTYCYYWRGLCSSNVSYILVISLTSIFFSHI